VNEPEQEQLGRQRAIVLGAAPPHGVGAIELQLVTIAGWVSLFTAPCW
jgi:hypothetical protein